MLLICNSDFISKVDNVIKHFGDNTAKNIIKKAEVNCNDIKVLLDSFKELEKNRRFLKESGLTKAEIGPAVAGALDTKNRKILFWNK